MACVSSNAAAAHNRFHTPQRYSRWNAIHHRAEELLMMQPVLSFTPSMPHPPLSASSVVVAAAFDRAHSVHLLAFQTTLQLLQPPPVFSRVRIFEANHQCHIASSSHHISNTHPLLAFHRWTKQFFSHCCVVQSSRVTAVVAAAESKQRQSKAECSIRYKFVPTVLSANTGAAGPDCICLPTALIWRC